jgi:hypothetical protein
MLQAATQLTFLLYARQSYRVLTLSGLGAYLTRVTKVRRSLCKRYCIRRC